MSRLRTTIVCALTTNLDRARAPGNVLLDRDEGNLSKQDVVNVSQVFTVDRDQLQTHIGQLSPTLCWIFSMAFGYCFNRVICRSARRQSAMKCRCDGNAAKGAARESCLTVDLALPARVS